MLLRFVLYALVILAAQICMHAAIVFGPLIGVYAAMTLLALEHSKYASSNELNFHDGQVWLRPWDHRYPDNNLNIAWSVVFMVFCSDFYH